MSQVPVQRSTVEQRLGRVLQLSAFVIFCLFAAAIGWHYEGLDAASEAGQRKPPAARGSASGDSRPTAVQSTTTEQDASSRDQLAGATAALRTGHFEFAIDFRDGSHATASLVFDLNDDIDHEPRMQLDYSYTYIQFGSQRTRTIRLQQLVIGNQIWQSSNSEPWPSEPKAISSPDYVLRYVERFLPHGEAMQSARLLSDAPDTLTWTEVDQQRQVTVEIDPAAGTPLELTRADSNGGTVMTVTYSGWNTVETISAP